MPWPVVAEVRKVCSGLIPRRRNSWSGSDSPRSLLLSNKMTGLLDFRAVLAMFLSFWSGYFEESKASRIRSAVSTASAIWSWMPASKSSSGSFKPAVSMRRN